MKQTVWDWRAAGNFAAGGTGSGLALCAALASLLEPARASQLAALLAALFILAGLALVGGELGRPLRFFRVFAHPKTSWMTRESLIAPVLVVVLLAAAWSGRRELLWLAGLLAAAMLYAQAQMVAAARGIPAWREPRIVPLLVATGLAEGGGMYLILSTLSGRSMAIAVYVLFLILLRCSAWANYTAHVKNLAGPIRAVLMGSEFPLLAVGTVLPIVLLASALMLPAAIAQPLAALAGIVTLASGWELKYAIVTRAGFTQGFALPRFPA